MSITETAVRPSTDGRGPASDLRRAVPRETKPSVMTTELWAMVLGVVALVVIYNASSDRSLDLFRASLLATILATGYMISRGLAKSGSRDTHQNDRSDY